jgi:hypothetical protein
LAQTFIGRLILRMQAEGLGEAQRVTSAMADIERRARAMATGPAGSWGVAFQRNLERLKTTPGELDEIRNSWVRLNDSFKERGIDKALRSTEISTWKNATIGHFASVRSAHAQQLAAIEQRQKLFASNIATTMKPVLVMLGGYTAFYLGGVMGREALTASSERRREIFRQTMANIPEGDQTKIFDASEALGQQYPSIPITAIMEMARSGYSVMGDADRAISILERMTQALVVLQSAKGGDAAANHLIGLIRGMDNLGLNAEGIRGIEQVNELIDAAVKAAQVDPDFDPGAFFGFARRSKVAGPALSPDFLARASVYMQDMGADVAGNALGMAFKAFVLEAVGSAGGKRYLAERQRLGLRDGNGLIDAELFGSDPDMWVTRHLIPALERDGVDMTNDTAIATAIGKLSGNTNATGLLTRMVTQREQIERWLRLMETAMGTDAAERARHEDPFVGWESFKKALENLSAALIPIDTINTGLNSLADGINRLAAGPSDPL